MMQVLALVAAAVVLGFHVFVADLEAFWGPVIELTLEWAQANRQYEQAGAIAANPSQMAHALTIAFVWYGWTLYALYLLFGYRYAFATPEESGKYGRFCDLNFGRTIALILALLSVLGFATGLTWMQSIAVVLFAVFWLQGLAVVHWLFWDGKLPLFAVILTYVLLPIMNVFLVMALAVVGYTDAWFRYRRRAVAKE